MRLHSRFAGSYVRKNGVLKELWLAHNDLTCDDAYHIANMLKSNFYLQFLDLSNNNLQVRANCVAKHRKL